MTVDQGKDVQLSSNFTLTPSKNGVVVKATAGAEPIVNLLTEWGISNSGSGGLL